MTTKSVLPVFPLGLETSDSSNLKGFVNTGIIEHGPGAVMAIPEGEDSLGIPSQIRYNSQTDSYEGYYADGGWLPFGGGGVRWEMLSYNASHTLSGGRGYFFNNTTGASTATLPVVSKVGETVTICDAAGKFSTYPLTIDPNGKSLYGSTEPMVISTDNVAATFTWTGDEMGWVVTAGVGLGQGRVYSREIYAETTSASTSSIALAYQPDIVDVYLDGKRLSENKYTLNGFSVDFADPIASGVEVQIVQYTPIQLGNGSNSGSSSQVTWVYNDGSAVGGETTITVELAGDDVSEIYVNSARQQKGIGFTYDQDTNVITLAQPLEPEDEVIVKIGGDPTLYNQIDRTPNEVARAANVTLSQVILSSNSSTKLDGKTVLFDVAAQKAWGIPSGIPAGATIVSVTGSNMTYAPGNVVVSLIPTPNSAEELKALLQANTGAGVIFTTTGETVQQVIDSLDDDVAQLQSDQGVANGRIDYLYNEYNKIYESLESTKTYAAFCDSCLVLGKEVFIHRVSKTHLDDGGGVSGLYIMQKENGRLVTKYIVQPVAGLDFRDPSITWEPVSRRLVVTVQAYNVSTGAYNGGNVYIFSSAFALLSSFTIGAAGFFQWGKALRTPSGNMLVAAYSVNNAGVNLYTSTGNFDSPGSFTLTASIFNDDSSLSRTEVSIHYWKEFLVAVARTQDVATQSLQNMSISYTRDLSGATGWVTGGRLSAYTTVAPRLTTMPDGALCITAGSIANGFRGSVAAIITYDLLTFSTANTIFSGTVGDGGYHGITLTKDGLGIYTYMETDGHSKAATYLTYVDPNVVQMLKKPSSAPLRFFPANNVTYIGDDPFGTAASAAGGYITIYLKEAINNCRGLVLNLGGSTGSAQAVILQRADGTTFATLGGVNVTGTGTFYASHAGVNIPAGVYRITISNAYVCTGVRKNSAVLDYPDDRIYGLVNINGVVATAAQDVFVGFAV